MKKVMQVPADPALIQALDKIAKERGVARAEIIRDACQKLIRKLQEEEWDRECLEGYTRIPEDPAQAESYALAAAEVLEHEDW